MLEIFRPDDYFDKLIDIDIDELKTRGFRVLLLDLDNTLLPWKSSELPESTRNWVEKAKDVGFDICIVSNTHYPKRLRLIANELNVLCIDKALKPRKVGFERAAGIFGADNKDCVVVGDQIMTDTWGGNRAGMYTILVKPMDRKEFIGTKISRIFEKAIICLLGLRARKGTNQNTSQSDRRDVK